MFGVIGLIVLCFIGLLLLGGREDDWRDMEKEDEDRD